MFTLSLSTASIRRKVMRSASKLAIAWGDQTVPHVHHLESCSASPHQNGECPTKGQRKTVPGAIALLLSLSLTGAIPGGFPAVAQTNSPENYTTFAQWCENRDTLPPEPQKTVDALLVEAGTSECDRASSILSRRQVLPFSNRQISDLRP
ncbi:MAG TPA: hypothetical protein V6D27_09630, partial [Vampirovibrionales bacterium]